MSPSKSEGGSGGKNKADASQEEIEAIEIGFETELAPPTSAAKR